MEMQPFFEFHLRALGSFIRCGKIIYLLKRAQWILLLKLFPIWSFAERTLLQTQFFFALELNI